MNNRLLACAAHNVRIGYHGDHAECLSFRPHPMTHRTPEARVTPVAPGAPATAQAQPPPSAAP